MEPEPNAPKIQDYADAGGLRTYHGAEVAGESLVLLHGGFCTVETFSGLAPLLAERRAHGRTPDVDGLVTYDGLPMERPEVVARLVVDFLGATAGSGVG